MFKTKVECDLSGLEVLKDNVRRGASLEGRAGFDSSQKHPENGEPLSDIAYYNTFGSPKDFIPRRPFMQDAAQDASLEVGQKLAKNWKHVLKGKSPKKYLKDSANILSSYISNVIRTNNYIGNADYTIMLKGFDKPLTNTGHLAGAVKTEVGDNKGPANET